MLRSPQALSPGRINCQQCRSVRATRLLQHTACWSDRGQSQSSQVRAAAPLQDTEQSHPAFSSGRHLRANSDAHACLCAISGRYSSSNLLFGSAMKSTTFRQAPNDSDAGTIDQQIAIQRCSRLQNPSDLDRRQLKRKDPRSRCTRNQIPFGKCTGVTRHSTGQCTGVMRLTF